MTIYLNQTNRIIFKEYIALKTIKQFLHKEYDSESLLDSCILDYCKVGNTYKKLFIINGIILR